MRFKLLIRTIMLFKDNLSRLSRNIKLETCCICGSYSKKKGWLYSCSSEQCLAMHWDERNIRIQYPNLFKRKSFEKNKESIDNSIKELMKHSHLKVSKKKNHYSVYALRLNPKVSDTNKPKCYVGMTSLHSAIRMLNHLRGHRIGKKNREKITKKHTMCLFYYENNLSYEFAKDREGTLWQEFKDQNWEAFGGH